MVLDLVKVEPKKIDIKLILIILAILLLLIIISICSVFVVQNQIQKNKHYAQREHKIIDKRNAYTHYNMIKPKIKQTRKHSSANKLNISFRRKKSIFNI